MGIDHTKAEPRRRGAGGAAGGSVDSPATGRSTAGRRTERGGKGSKAGPPCHSPAPSTAGRGAGRDRDPAVDSPATAPSTAERRAGPATVRSTAGWRAGCDRDPAVDSPATVRSTAGRRAGLGGQGSKGGPRRRQPGSCAVDRRTRRVHPTEEILDSRMQNDLVFRGIIRKANAKGTALLPLERSGNGGHVPCDKASAR